VSTVELVAFVSACVACVSAGFALWVTIRLAAQSRQLADENRRLRQRIQTIELSRAVDREIETLHGQP
jgi:hypothetical protein